MKRIALRVTAALFLAPFLFVLAKCGVVHFEHNAEAARLLAELKRVSLPADAVELDDETIIEGFISGTGDATDVLAYRVFTSHLPPELVFHHFGISRDKSSGFADEGQRFNLIWLRDRPGEGLEEEFVRRRVPDATSNGGYVLYGAERLSGEGFWDIRGW